MDGLAKQVALVEQVMAEVSPGIPVRGALCFVDADLPLFSQLSFNGYPLLYPEHLAKRMNAESRLSEAQQRELAATVAARFPPPERRRRRVYGAGNSASRRRRSRSRRRGTRM